MENLVEIRGLRVETPRGKDIIQLVDTVDLTIRRKQSFGIVGESGCGKSVTASTLMQLLPYPLRAAEGTLLFDSLEGPVDLRALPHEKMRKLRGREISMIFQEPMTALDPIFTVEYQMNEALEFHHPNLSKREMGDKIMDMLRKVNIPRPEQTLKCYPHQLSGGQIQRIMIAIALINDPRLLIADEPTTALDVTIQAQILDLMNALKESRDTSIIMITHDLGVIAETCEEVAVFYAGQVVEQASAPELFHHTAHPYTLGLLHAITSLGGEERLLYTIPGIVPPGGMWAKGCRFSDRCAQCMDRCRTEMPSLHEIAPGHLCRCHLFGEGGRP